MTKQEKLLGKAINVYEDKEIQAQAIPATSLNGSNGFSYILIDTDSSYDIKCSIHLTSMTLQQSEFSYDSGTIFIETQTDLFSIFADRTNFIIISYNNYYIGIKNLYGYNEVNKTFRYECEIIDNKNKNFVITDSSEASEKLLSNSTMNWLLFGDYCGIPVYPSFLSPLNLETAYLSIEIISTIPVSTIWQDSDTIKKQTLKDKCKLSLINGTLNDSQNIIDYLYTQAEEKEYFGIMNSIAFSQNNRENQIAFDIKSNIRTAEFYINYELESDAETALKYITSALFTMNEFKLGG